MSNYERATHDPSFGTQHRYGVLSETRTGVLHIASLFYAFLRCAARETDPELRAQHLDDAATTAEKLLGMAHAAKVLVEHAKTRPDLLQELQDDPTLHLDRQLAHGNAVFLPLLKGYWGAIDPIASGAAWEKLKEAQGAGGC